MPTQRHLTCLLSCLRIQLRYFRTPSGLALKVKLTRSYMDVSLRVYRELRQAARQALTKVHRAGYTAVCVEGNDEAAEILGLTCLEQSTKVDNKSDRTPVLRVAGMSFLVTWPGGNELGGDVARWEPQKRSRCLPS
jgi:hypothetical protein